MSDLGQMRLEFAEVYRASEKWPKLLEVVRQVCTEIGRKEICHELEIHRGTLDNVLLDRDRHHLKASMLLYLMFKDKSGRILKCLAEMNDQRLEPRRPLTAEEKCRAYESTIRSKLGPLGAQLLDEALREAG